MPTIATYSLPLGTPLPKFKLPDVVTGKEFSQNELRGIRGTAVWFICRHCPYVVRIREELVRIASEYQERGISCVGISSNDVENYPEDAPEKLAEMAREVGFTFPLLYDASQEVARAFTAACTPDLFLYDQDGRLFYRGRLDPSTPGNEWPVTGEDFRRALDALLAGEGSPAPQNPSLGCGIKWKQAKE